REEAVPQNGTSGHSSIHLISWRWEEYSSILLFNLMIILAAVFKVGFHQASFMRPHNLRISGWGLVAKLLVFTPSNPFPTFSNSLFFNVLLPPVILDSAYSLYDREFISNLGSVLTFAIFGTLINIFAVGGALKGTQPMECFTFSTLISAVDPVAVLAIFEEVGVNLGLYFLVFGESLLNDGVTIVIYNTVTVLEDKSDIVLWDYGLAVLSFLAIAGGGFGIGVTCGIITAVLLKYTRESRVIEPLCSLRNLHWSGIMALIGCGVTQKRYAFPNASNKTRGTIKYGVQTLSSVSDAIIFLFLGNVSLSQEHDFHLYFVLWTLLLITVTRFFGVFFLSAIINTQKTSPFLLKNSSSWPTVVYAAHDTKAYKPMIMTTTIIVILFTVFIQGGTIKLLVSLLNIRRKDESKDTLSDIINGKLIDQTMGGLEAITGSVSKYRIINLIEYVDKNYIMKYILSNHSLINLEQKLRDVTMDEHYARLFGPSLLAKGDALGGIEGSLYASLISRVGLIDPSRQSLKYLLNSSPYEQYRRRLLSRSHSFDDHILRELDSNRERASRFKHILSKNDERRKLLAYSRMGMRYVRPEPSQTKDYLVKLIKDEYKSGR
ncbi:Sodium/hydrogen exchanger, partial [Caligus rogercresseyi]